MIGKITLPDGRVAILEDDIKWTSDDRDLRLYLNRLFRDYTPDHGYPGVLLIEKAAEDLKAKAEFAERPPQPPLGPNEVY